MTLLWRKFLECSSSLLTSLSLCPHSYGGSFWSVLPHCSLRHPCVLTHFVIPVSSLTSSSLCPHSLRHPCVLTPMTCLLTHLIVIPDFSLESSHPSHPWLLTPITRVTTHPILSVLTHTHTHRTNPSHLIVIPDYSLPSLVPTMLTHPRLFSHHSYYHSLTRVFSH